MLVWLTPAWSARRSIDRPLVAGPRADVLGDRLAARSLMLVHSNASLGVGSFLLSTSWTQCASIMITSDIDDGTHSNGVWSVNFWNDDGAINPSDHIDTICEPNGMGGCTFIPLQYLRWGSVYWEEMATRPAAVR